MRTLLIISLALFSVSTFASSDFECNFNGDLGDILCLSAKSKAKKCALRACERNGFPKCKVIDVSSHSTPWSAYKSCEAKAVVLGSY